MYLASRTVNRMSRHSDDQAHTRPTTRTASLSALDVEILRFLTRFGMARPHHVVAWTGASPHTIRRRLKDLGDRGAIRSFKVTAGLRGADGRVRETVCSVHATTVAGTRYIGEWQVPGYDRPVTLPVPRHSRMLAMHTLGVTDLAAWYRIAGFAIASEREIRSVELESKIAPDRPTRRFWCVQLPGRVGVHPPDLGAVDVAGQAWAVELERSCKTVQEYFAIIAAYRAAGMGQVWHIETQATARRVMDACARLGVTWRQEGGVSVSDGDGLIRLQGWVPGRAALCGPEAWQTRKLFPRSSPASIPGPDVRPDLSAAWRRGRILDAEAEELVGGILW